MVCSYMVIGAVYALRIIGLAGFLGQQSPLRDRKRIEETCCFECESPKKRAMTLEGV